MALVNTFIELHVLEVFDKNKALFLGSLWWEYVS